MNRLTILLLLFLPMTLAAQDVWTEGTEWVVTYSDGDVHTYTLSGTTTFDDTAYLNMMDDHQEEPIGYVRAEHGDTTVYARAIIDEETTGEFLLYDFGTFEPGSTFRYSFYDYDNKLIRTPSVEIEADSLTYLHDIIEEGDILPCCSYVVFKLGYIGGPMDLFYGGVTIEKIVDEEGDAPTPRTRNVSHIVFRPKGRKGAMIFPSGIYSLVETGSGTHAGYNLSGVPVKPPFSGIVIVDGKKRLY